MRFPFRLRLSVFAACFFLTLPAPAQRRGGGGAAPEPFAFRFMGPAVGNRIAAVAGVPGDPTTYYAGAASGGVWKSTDGGTSWAPIFDNQPAQAIGALAVAPSDHKIVWAGTGEAWAIRDSDMMGDGIYKSTDAGATWQHMGLDETGRIGRIIVHPTNPDIVYVCAVGRATGPQQERGVFRTSDGGKTWNRVLFVDPDTGCSGLSMDAHDPEHAVRRHVAGGACTPTPCSAAGRRSGVYITHDGGANWKQLEGARACRTRRWARSMWPSRPSNSKRVYALIQTADQGSLWRSDDGGENWTIGKLAAGADRPRGLLHPPGRLAYECRRGAGGQQQLLAIHRRRQELPQRARGAATRTTSGTTRRTPIASASRTMAACA